MILEEAIPSMLRRSARIAARNDAKVKAEIAALAAAFHNSHYEHAVRPAKKVKFVQNDLASYNPFSREYLVTIELLKRQNEATCEVCQVECFISILSWLMHHPQLLHQIKGFPNVVHKKMLEFQVTLKNYCSTVFTGLIHEPANKIRQEKMALLCAYNEALGYVRIMQMILDKMAA